MANALGPFGPDLSWLWRLCLGARLAQANLICALTAAWRQLTLELKDSNTAALNRRRRSSPTAKRLKRIRSQELAQTGRQTSSPTGGLKPFCLMDCEGLGLPSYYTDTVLVFPPLDLFCFHHPFPLPEWCSRWER